MRGIFHTRILDTMLRICLIFIHLFLFFFYLKTKLSWKSEASVVTFSWLFMKSFITCILISTVHQITAWKQCDCVKMWPLLQWPCKFFISMCSSPQLYSALQLVSAHCLSARCATLLSWHNHTLTLIAMLFVTAGGSFQSKRCTDWLCTVFSAPKRRRSILTILKHLAAKEWTKKLKKRKVIRLS